jgi:hypothetical protein
MYEVKLDHAILPAEALLFLSLIFPHRLFLQAQHHKQVVPVIQQRCLSLDRFHQAPAGIGIQLPAADLLQEQGHPYP